MSIRFHRGPTLITLFHDARSPASSRILALLRSHTHPNAAIDESGATLGGPAYLDEIRGSLQQHTATVTSAAREASARSSSESIPQGSSAAPTTTPATQSSSALTDVELEVKDRQREPPTPGQWSTILSYLRDEPDDLPHKTPGGQGAAAGEARQDMHPAAVGGKPASPDARAKVRATRAAAEAAGVLAAKPSAAARGADDAGRGPERPSGVGATTEGVQQTDASTDFARQALAGERMMESLRAEAEEADEAWTPSAGGFLGGGGEAAGGSLSSGPLVVNWQDGMAVTTEAGVRRMLEQLRHEAEAGRKSSGVGSGSCVVS